MGHGTSETRGCFFGVATPNFDTLVSFIANIFASDFESKQRLCARGHKLGSSMVRRSIAARSLVEVVADEGSRCVGKKDTRLLKEAT